MLVQRKNSGHLTPKATHDTNNVRLVGQYSLWKILWSRLIRLTKWQRRGNLSFLWPKLKVCSSAVTCGISSHGEKVQERGCEDRKSHLFQTADQHTVWRGWVWRGRRLMPSSRWLIGKIYWSKITSWLLQVANAKAKVEERLYRVSVIERILAAKGIFSLFETFSMTVYDPQIWKRRSEKYLRLNSLLFDIICERQRLLLRWVKDN